MAALVTVIIIIVNLTICSATLDHAYNHLSPGIRYLLDVNTTIGSSLVTQHLPLPQCKAFLLSVVRVAFLKVDLIVSLAVENPSVVTHDSKIKVTVHQVILLFKGLHLYLTSRSQ